MMNPQTPDLLLILSAVTTAWNGIAAYAIFHEPQGLYGSNYPVPEGFHANSQTVLT